MRSRDKVPGILHKGLDAAIKTGNNLGLPKEDFTFILEDVGEEIAEEPGFEEFSVPVDKKNANILTTIHNKLVNTHTDDLKHWWKIFFAAKEDWTVPSDNWEGTNWGLFTGDDESMKVMVGRIVENMEALEAKNLLWPEWGHAYLATRSGLEKWYPEALNKFGAVTVFDLLIQYIKEGKINFGDLKMGLREDLSKELIAHKIKDVDRDNKNQVIPKEQIKKMIGKSPDISDSIMFRMWFELQPKGSYKIMSGGGVR